MNRVSRSVRITAYALCLALVTLISLSAYAADQRAVSIKKMWKSHKNRVMIMSHRGEHNKAPENTIVAYEKAIEAGAHFVEVDVRLTRDNHWVVYHNRVIQTRSGERKVLSSMTYDVIKSLTISGKRHGLPDQNISTLHEVLEALRGRVLIYLDDKMGRPLELAEIIREHKMEDQVVVGINDYADAILMSEFAEDIAWRGRVHTTDKDIDRFLALKPVMLEVNNVYDLSTEMIKRIHKAGAKIMVNCLGHRDSNKYYHNYVQKVGADVIQTDNLDRLTAFLEGLDAA